MSGPASSFIMKKLRFLITLASTLWDMAETSSQLWSLHIYTYCNWQRVNSSTAGCELLERVVIVLNHILKYGFKNNKILWYQNSNITDEKGKHIFSFIY